MFVSFVSLERPIIVMASIDKVKKESDEGHASNNENPHPKVAAHFIGTASGSNKSNACPIQKNIQKRQLDL